MKQDMNNWKIVSQIAMGFGIVFIAFAIFAAILNVELIPFEVGSGAPDRYVQLSALNSMLIYLLFAALSLTVAWITRRSSKVSREMPSMTSELKEETQTEEINHDSFFTQYS